MPDHGWEALANSVTKTFTPIKNTGQDPAADQDNSPKAETIVADLLDPDQSEPFGKTGDGLSTFQEYRGFVVNGSHRRLNPHNKDVFILFDETVSAALRPGVVAGAQTLTVTVHALALAEASLNEVGLAPVINENRTGVPGASTEQRAVLLRANENNAPSKVMSNGDVYPAWAEPYKYAGLTFYDGFDLKSIFNPQIYRSPNGTQVAEIYPRAFVQHRIYPNKPSPTLPSEFDFYSTISCLTPGHGCDAIGYDENGKKFLGPGEDGILNTLCHPSDICQGLFFTCVGNNPVVVSQNFTSLQVFAMTHEFGHGLNMFHAYDISGQPGCGTMMGYQALPVPTTFSDVERQMLRIHENF
jgi:hypothetical protein